MSETAGVSRSIAKAWLLLTLAPLFWSGNWVAGRALRDTLTPITLNTLRWGLALAILTVMVWPQRRAVMRGIAAQPLVYGMLGLCGIVIFQMLLYYGLHTTTVINGSLLNSSMPLWMVIGGTIWLNERWTRWQMIGGAISMLGVLAVIAHGDLSRLGSLQFTPGDLLLLFSMGVWTAYCIILKRARLELQGWAQLTAIVAMAVIIMLPFCIADVAIAGHPLPGDLKTWAAVAYVGSFASVGALYCWNEGMKLTGAGTSSFFYHLMPVFGTLWSILLLGEEPRLYHAYGFALILAGVYLATAFRRS